MAPFSKKATEKPFVPKNGHTLPTADSLATARASNHFPWTTYAIILWPSEQDENVLKALLAEYKSKILRASILTEEELEKLRRFQLDHLLKDGNARYLEKDYPRPEFYECENGSHHAAVRASTTPARQTTRGMAVQTVEEEDKGVKIAIPEGIHFQIPATRIRNNDGVAQHSEIKNLEDIEREIHLLLITSKEKPGRAHQAIDLKNPVDFDEALKYLESLHIPGGVGRVRAVGLISGSPSSIYSEWEDEDEDKENEELNMIDLKRKTRHGRAEMKKKGINTEPKVTTIDFGRRNHGQNFNTESRLLDEKSGYGSYLKRKKNDLDHGSGTPYLGMELLDGNTTSTRSLGGSRIPIPISSGRLRTPGASKMTKRRNGRPPARPEKRQVSYKKPSAAAAIGTAQPPEANFPAFDGSATSEAPEVNVSGRSSTNRFKNWHAYPPVTPQQQEESQSSSSSAVNTSIIRSSTAGNEDLEKRIDSGFHLSSLPPAERKQKGNTEARKSPLGGYPRKMKGADVLASFVKPSLIPKSISGSWRSSPLMVMKGTRQPLPLVVTRTRRSQPSRRKDLAGGVLSRNLAIEGFGSLEAGGEWGDISNRSAATRHSPTNLSVKVETPTKTAERYPTHLSATMPSSSQGNVTSQALLGNADSISLVRAPAKGVEKQGAAERHLIFLPVPAITITSPEEEEEDEEGITTNQTPQEPAAYTSPSQTPTTYIKKKGTVAERYPSFLPLPTFTLTTPSDETETMSQPPQEEIDYTSPPQIADSNIEERDLNCFLESKPLSDEGPRRRASCSSSARRQDGMVVRVSGDMGLKLSVDGVDEEEAGLPGPFQIPKNRRLDLRIRGEHDLVETMTSPIEGDETTEICQEACVEDENDRIRTERSEVPAMNTVPKSNSSVDRADDGNKSSKSIVLGMATYGKRNGGESFFGQDPDGHVSGEDATFSSATPQVGDLKEKKRHRGTELRSRSKQHKYGQDGNGLLVHKKFRAGADRRDMTSQLRGKSAITNPSTDELAEEEEEARYRDTEISSSPQESHHLPTPSSSSSSTHHHQIPPLPTPLAIQKHTLRPHFLRQYPDTSLAQDHLWALWKQAASKIPPKNLKSIIRDNVFYHPTRHTTQTDKISWHDQLMLRLFNLIAINNRF